MGLGTDSAWRSHGEVPWARGACKTEPESPRQPRPYLELAACPIRPAGLHPETAGARRGVPAAGSAFRRRGEVGEVVEELRGLGKAGDEVLVEDDFGGVVERVLGQALAVVAALPGVPQGVGAGDERDDHGEEYVCHVCAVVERGGPAVDPLVVGAAVRDDDGGLVPDLAPDAGGGVGVGVGGPAREVLRRDGGVGPPGALELDPAVPVVVDRGGGPVVQPPPAGDLGRYLD